MILTYFNTNPRVSHKNTEATQEMLESDEPANVTRIESATFRELDRSTNHHDFGTVLTYLGRFVVRERN
jgi:hypothetical protein